MKSKKTLSSRFHQIIKTKHVYIENNQVFVKRYSQKLSVANTHDELWLPTNFQWIPITAFEQE